MSKPYYQLLYFSTATPELTEDALTEILMESQNRNAKRNITGLLLHSDGNIIQIIEGEKEDVEALFAKIEHDKRHRGVLVLSRKHVEKRDFPEYKMGFRRPSRDLIEAQIPGFTDFVERGTIPPHQLEGLSTLVATFLRTFARSTGLSA